jgi:uncharacterized protein YpbB
VLMCKNALRNIIHIYTSPGFKVSTQLYDVLVEMHHEGKEEENGNVIEEIEEQLTQFYRSVKIAKPKRIKNQYSQIQ